MAINPKTVKHTRKLVVTFDFYAYGMVKTDHGDRPQLVHEEPQIDQPSRLVRLATRLRLTKGNKALGGTVAKAYTFVSRNYRQGDHVILVVRSRSDIRKDSNVKAAEILAKHLHNGTDPIGLSHHQIENDGVIPARIPIYCVAVGVAGGTKSMSECNDECKSRFPAGIEHVICWAYGDKHRSCVTQFDTIGGIISREICISWDLRGYKLWINFTKHVIHYEEDQIPPWDEHKPVWIKEINSYAANIPGTFLESTKPVGMYFHELRKYQGLPGLWKGGSMLVWKSYRSVDERHV
ncbi:unnamed protein product [Rhizoctonia solani]|nr:unnamed protein product [Rhizoctonia solani]